MLQYVFLSVQERKAQQFFASTMAEQEKQRQNALQKGPMHRLDWVSFSLRYICYSK